MSTRPQRNFPSVPALLLCLLTSLTGCVASSKATVGNDPLPDLPANLRACAERELPDLPKGPLQLTPQTFVRAMAPQRKALAEKDGCARDLVAFYDDMVETRR